MGKIWITIIESKTHHYLFEGGGYRDTDNWNAAQEKGRKIRAAHPELKSARIKSYKTYDPLFALNELLELPIGAQ